MMEITDKEFKELAEKEAIDMWGHYSTGELHRAYFIDAYTKGFREALKQVKNNGVLDDVKKCAFDCDNLVWEKGASYCKEHMECDDWS